MGLAVICILISVRVCDCHLGSCSNANFPYIIENFVANTKTDCDISSNQNKKAYRDYNIYIRAI